MLDILHEERLIEPRLVCIKNKMKIQPVFFRNGIALLYAAAGALSFI